MTAPGQFNRTISVGHIITTIGLIVGGFTFIYDLKNKVAIQEFKISAIEERLERVVGRTDDQFDQIMDHLVRLEEKIDVMSLTNGE
tara:strand:+ start:52 stop:309 length:258 start_codon:yes stop_codon:yes gene_type:complete